MDRLYRFSIPGITFLLASWFFVYALTGINLLSERDLYKDILAALISTPIIGLILTTFFHALLHGKKRKGKSGPYWLYLPMSIDQRVFSEFSPTQAKPEKKKDWKVFYWNYQAYIRQNLESETIQFLTRRWTYCFVHYNNFWALGMALIFSFVYKFWVGCSGQFQSSLFLLGVITLVMYIFTGLYLASFALNDARNVEHQAVSNCLKKEDEDKKSGLKT
jgi:hypothetical protein